MQADETNVVGVLGVTWERKVLEKNLDTKLGAGEPLNKILFVVLLTQWLYCHSNNV